MAAPINILLTDDIVKARAVIHAVEEVAAADMSTIHGSAIIKNADRDWYGQSYNIGDVGNSFGWSGGPYVAPATTTTADVTFPLTNATIPFTDCAQLLPEGGSFMLGGKRVCYLGRSASSGAGNATGCYSTADATGTVASGTTPTLQGTGFFALTVYKRFGYDGIPIAGSTQGFGVVTSYKAPTVDDSAESGSFVVNMADPGTPTVQHQTVTGGEMTAQLLGNWSMPDGVGAALAGGGVRTHLSATDHAKAAIGLKITHENAGFVGQYFGIYQLAAGVQVFGTLNGDAALPQSTIPVTGTFPPATAAYPVTVRVGANAQGMGGQAVTYTGQSGGNLTGCTGGSGTVASGSNVTNFPLGASFRDPVLSDAGFVASLAGWSAEFRLALKGGQDSLNSMLSLTGPTNAEVPGGLTLARLNAGSGQTKSILQAIDSGGNVKFAIGASGALNLYSTAFTFNQSGTAAMRLDCTGFLQPGISTSACVGATTAQGVKIYSGSGAPTSSLIGASSTPTNVGDLYLRTDGANNLTIYRCTAVTGSPVTSVTWTPILSTLSLDLATATLTGTTAQFNTALSDADFATLDSNGNLTADNVILRETITATAAGTTTLDINATQVQVFTGTTTQTVKLPTTGVIAGQPYTIINQSTGNVTVQSSGANSIQTLTTGRMAIFMAKVDTPTAASDWQLLCITASTSASVNTMAQRDGSGSVAANAFIPSCTSTATAAGTTALAASSTETQVFTGSTTQTVTLPNTSVVAGQRWKIINKSSGTVTVNSSAGNLVKSLAAGASTVVTAVQATPTADTHWDAT